MNVSGLRLVHSFRQQLATSFDWETNRMLPTSGSFGLSSARFPNVVARIVREAGEPALVGVGYVQKTEVL